MIKIKLENTHMHKETKKQQGKVTLWIDGEFQIIHEGNVVGGQDCCAIKVLELETAIPSAKVEIIGRDTARALGGHKPTWEVIE